MLFSYLKVLTSLPTLQTQKAWEARREYDQKQAEATANEAGGFRGPDGSSQWVSVGELGAEAIDDALMGLAGGSGIHYRSVQQVQGASMSKVSGGTPL